MGRRSNFYRSDDWLNFRRIIMMERRGPDGVLLCEHCGKPIVNAYDCIGHHTDELTEENVADPTVSLNPEKVVLVHHRCHNDIHKRFGVGAVKPDRRVFYVWGSPLAGKTTLVREAAGRDDLVVDMDAIYRAISTNPLHRNSPVLKDNAFMVRDCLLDQVKTRAGRWRNAWVIATEALATNRARMVDVLGAEEIHVDTDRATCIERANERGGKAVEYTERFWRRLT